MRAVPRSIVLSLSALVAVASISAQVAERPAASRPSAHGAYVPTKDHWKPAHRPTSAWMRRC